MPGSAIIIAVVASFSTALMMQGAGGKWTCILLSLLLSAAVIGKYVYAAHVSLLSLTFFIPVIITPIQRWPFKVLVPLLAYGLIVSFVPSLRASVGWLKRGKTDSGIVKMIAATAVISALALVGWVIFAKPELEHHIDLLPELPFWAYPLAGAGFALLNAALEEAVFRGVVMEALDSTLGAGHLSVLIQAGSFAALHYLAGFPNGMPGFILVFIYGIMLGAIRRASKGILAPFIAHIAADITIFSIVAYMYLSATPST